MFGLSKDGTYIEWKEKEEQSKYDFGQYIVCRNPSVTHPHPLIVAWNSLS
jgi:hypothetical protein